LTCSGAGAHCAFAENAISTARPNDSRRIRQSLKRPEQQNYRALAETRRPLLDHKMRLEPLACGRLDVHEELKALRIGFAG
jgi:hypothetical protein